LLSPSGNFNSPLLTGTPEAVGLFFGITMPTCPTKVLMFRVLKIAGTCILSGALALAIISAPGHAQAKLKVLHTFTSGIDGCYPVGGLILDGAGNVYGTTAGGNTCNCGTVFEIPAGGTETPLYDFTCGANGDGPGATLVMDRKGNLYGTTENGGSIGCGVIFRVAPDGAEKTVHDFAGQPNDGCTPEGALIIDAEGNFYSTTNGGGKYRSNGTVFRLAPDGTETVLYNFCAKPNCADGGDPYAGVIMDAAGNLYGTTQRGGSRRCSYECGTVFSLGSNGVETVLYKFRGSPSDGSIADGTLLADKSGNFYGTLAEGGHSGCESNSGCGAVFKIAPSGSETILHLFTAKHGDGGNPIGGLIADGTGNLYGTTEFGGSQTPCNGFYGCGTVFKIAPDGTETIVHSLGDGSKGANPVAGLVMDNAGNLYGTASDGGASGFGTVFEITP
jgi:uncharacterized repeat protein (TIGR03803 family)